MKIAVFIDGSNLYGKLKELNMRHTSQFNFRAFILQLTGDVAPSYVGYYVGKIRKEKSNPKSEILYASQQKLFANMRINMPNLNIVCGHIQNFKGVYKEKGVDVRLALDIYKLANQNVYDKALLISSDTDLIPAIKMVQTANRVIEYVGFFHNPSMAMIRHCKEKKLLTYNDIKAFEFTPST